MFLQFFTSLRDAQVPVTLREYLTLMMEALDADLAEQTVENFYYLSRAALVKDERNLDKFEPRVRPLSSRGWKGLLDAMDKGGHSGRVAEKSSPEKIPHRGREEADRGDGLGQAHGDASQAARGTESTPSRAANKWIGTAGTLAVSAAQGYNPEGVRIGQEKNRNNRAVKSVGTSASSRDLDGNVELGIRNIKIRACAALRKFARTGAPDELDLDTTIRGDRQPRLSRRRDAPGAAQRGSRCWCSSTSAAPWIPISSRSRNCFRRQKTEIQAHGIFLLPQLPSMKASGSQEQAALHRPAPRPGTCCINIRTTTRWCSSATPR